MRSNLDKAFAEALELAEKNGFTFLLEPLNLKVDHPGFYLDSTAEAFEIIRKFDTPHLKLLFDMYHMQIMEGNIVANISDNIDMIGHFHVAGVPGRAEPHACELNYPYIFRQVDQLGYQGRFGLEYFPNLESTESLELQLKMVG
jgi:hydroxypyruvate isomerase